MIFDSDVLIWTLRGHQKAARVVEQDGDRAIAVVSSMELFQGARDRREMAMIRQFLSDFDTFPLSAEIGYRACLYMEQHTLGVRLTPLDALIASTAVERQQTLCTANVKHYRQIAGLVLAPFRP